MDWHFVGFAWLDYSSRVSPLDLAGEHPEYVSREAIHNIILI